MKRTTNDTETMTEEALVAAAGRGDEPAFDELHRRHAPLAWRLALAITGRPDEAAAAVAAGTGTTFTAMRAGRFQAEGHAVTLCAATRNAALDLRRERAAGRTSVPADDADPVLAEAFSSLPERWRSVLWLRDAEGLEATEAAPVVELTPEATDQLAVRARRGLRERFLKAQVAAAASRDCSRAVVRLGALEDGTLSGADQATLERHLDQCEDCTDRHVRVASMTAGLAALAVAPAADLHERSKAAWSAALATPSSITGLSPRTEKVLAGVSAFAAAVGVLGAALFGTGGGEGDAVASPLAPLVSEIATPRPVDLSDLAIPVVTPVSNIESARRSLSGTWMPTSPATDAAGNETAAAPEGTTSTDGGTPAAESPGTAPAIETQVGDTPISVDLGEDPGLVAGPVEVQTDPDEDLVTIEDQPEQLDPITDAVNEATDPVVEAAEPVLDAAEPVTQPIAGTIGDVAGGLGL